MYTYKEVYEATKEYFSGDELLTDIWISKYTLKDKKGNYYELTPESRINLIVDELVRIESNYGEIDKSEFRQRVFNLIRDFKYFIPGGSIIYGLGNKQFLSSLGNCFVIGNKTDSYGSICKIDEEQVQLMKRRGGVGHDLSHLRPKGVPVNGCANTSTGSVSFASRYSHSTREVAQDGRRGALMLTHHINHPDVVDFIKLKDDTSKVTGANISVKVTDEFMNNVLSNGEHKFKFPINSEKEHSKTNAKDLFDKLIHQAWKNGEPGVLFWDKIIRESPADCYEGFETESTNPCGELPLSPYDSCRLGHINLYAYIENPYTINAKFNREKFEQDIILAQRLMDNVIDLEKEKINDIIFQIENSYDDEDSRRNELQLWVKIKEALLSGRRTGLGMLGEADAVAALGYTYASKEANEFIVNAHKILALKSYESSILLAKERGAFPIWNIEKEKNNPFINRILGEINRDWESEKGQDNPLIWDYEEYGRRNISNLTIAPTGSTAQLVDRQGVSSGIEPVFEVFYKRRRKINPNDKNTKSAFVDEVGDHWEEYNVFHHKFKVWADINGYDTSKLETMKQSELDEIIKKSPYYKATSNDVNWVEKVKMQGKIQKWVDHSISVTINLPSDVTEELVSEVYQTGWESGCKGITVYRDGSRSGVLVTKSDNKKSNIFQENNAPKRPESLPCDVYRFQNKGEKWIGFMGLYDNRPYEIFTGLLESVNIPNNITKGEIIKVRGAEQDGHTRYDFVYIDKDGYKQEFRGLSRAFNREFWNTGRLISAILRHGMPLPNVLQIMDKLIFDSDDVITSWKQGIKRIIKKYIKEGTMVKGQVCDNCQSERIVFKEGCMTCLDCGTSKCE